jgi:hypothetical protein
MILRRIIEHFRKQEWTAIAFDFLIVVLGVFVGLQVSNWNAARLDRRDERKLLIRLYDETGVLSGRLKAESERIVPFMDTLWSLRPALLAGAPRGPLSDYECWTLAASHATTSLTDDLPTLDEILSTGRLDLIENRIIKEKLREFAYNRNKARAVVAGANNEPFRLANRHPDLLQYKYEPDSDVPLPDENAAGLDYRHQVQCHLEELRASPSFLNDYVDNLGRLRATIKFGLYGMQEQVEALQATLVSELNIQPKTAETEQ